MLKTFAEAADFFEKRKNLGIKPGLERVEAMLEAAGNPQEKLRAVHIAGTNGKGSTAHFLMNALIENGKTVGFFTSPSFSGLTGHMFINHQPMPDMAFVQELNRLLPVIEKLDAADNGPTFYEIITVLAFMHFEGKVDIAIIEACMGGRYDTTNCFDPMLSIITNIAKDHTAFLGDALAEIAFHKAGILKQGRPGIIGEMAPEALSVIEKEAEEVGAPLYLFSQAFTIADITKTTTGQTFNWQATKDAGEAKAVSLTMRGLHQVKNASLAIMALSLLDEMGIVIDWQQALHGMENTTVAARFEQISEHPIVVLDGAHNPAGMHTFVATAQAFAPEKRKIVIFSAFKDKEVGQMLDMLDVFPEVILTTFDHPRAYSPNALQTLAEARGLTVMPDWQAAMAQSLKIADDACIFVTGSLHFMLEVRQYIEQRSVEKQ